jgi:hypothetical protein
LLAWDGVELEAARKVIQELANPETSQDAPLADRVAVLVKAWRQFATDAPLTKANCKPRYGKDPIYEVWHLDEWPVCGGIDLGEGKEHVKPDVTTESNGEPEEPEPADPKVHARQQKVAEAVAKVEAIRQAKAEKQSPSLAEELEAIRAQHPGMMLLMKSTTVYRAWGVDAGNAAKVLKTPLIQQSGLPVTEFPHGKLKVSLQKLTEAGYRCAVVERVAGAYCTIDPQLGMPAPGKPAHKPTKKPSKS